MSKSSTGLAALLFGSAVNGVVQVVVVAALARMLSPAVFGAFAAGMVVVRFIEIIAALGVGPALVQVENVDDGHVAAAFWASLGGAVVVGAAAYVAAPSLEVVLAVDGAGTALRGLIVAVPVTAAGAVAQALLERDGRFVRLSIVDPVSYLVGFAPAAIALAATGHGLLSLVAGQVARAFVASVILVFSRRHPIRGAHRGAWRTAVSSGLMFSRLMSHAARQIDSLVVGRVHAAAALGLYSRATRITTLPVGTMSLVVSRVLFTRMSRLQNDAAAILDAYRSALTLTALVLLPFGAAMCVLADGITALLLGDAWGGAAAPLRVLAAICPLAAMHQVGLALLNARGLAYEAAWRSTVHAAIVVAGIIGLAGYGILGAAMAVAAAELVRTAITVPQWTAASGARASTYLAALRPGVVCAVVAAAVAAGVNALAAPLGVAAGAGVALACATVVVVALLVAVPRLVCGRAGCATLADAVDALPPPVAARASSLAARFRRASAPP